MNPAALTRLLKEEAFRLGFEGVGVARAEALDEEARRLEAWLHKGFHGNMRYMENHFEKRTDPRKLVEGARSVVTLLYNYYTDQQQKDPEAPKLSMYAYGEDYHGVLKHKLRTLLHTLQEAAGAVHGRCFVDSAPVMEREWAKRGGLGWLGKNTLLIHPRKGSWFFLAVLILDIDLEYDGPMKDYCGRCRRCIDACPTGAIATEGYLLDASRCISYLTIELRDAIPAEFAGHMDNWMFGCDICQEVCPWNRFAQPHRETAFDPPPELLDMQRRDWEELTEAVFTRLFSRSAVKRTGYEGLQRNIRFLRQDGDDPDAG